MAIDRLPDLVLFKLISFLSWQEMIRLKAVCRELNSLLTSYLIEVPRRLFVHRKVISLIEHWGSQDQPVQPDEFIQLKLFLRCLAAGYFKNVKYLHLFKLNTSYNDLRPFGEASLKRPLLNCLAKLDELFVTDEVRLINLFDTDEVALVAGDRKLIDLPNLKSLSIKGSLGYRPRMQINSQRLESLVVWARDRQAIILSNPEKVRYIECIYFSEQEFEVNRFPNLERLNCQSLTANFDISNYPKLKKLDICPTKEQFLNGLQIVQRLLTQKKTLNHTNLEITVFGFKGLTPVALERENELDGPTLKLDKLKKLENNFSNFVLLPWRTSTLISPDVEANLQNLPRFIRQLNIDRVTLSRDPNPALAIQFLEAINGVSMLRISGCSYDQFFYNQLTLVPCIKLLKIDCNSQMSEVTSFDFICKIRFLQEFYINDCELSLEELEDAIGRSEVEIFRISQYLYIPWKRLWFVANKSDKPFTVTYRMSKSRFESWKDAVRFVRKCEHANRQLNLNDRGALIGSFVVAPQP